MRLIDEEALMEDIQKTITEQSGTIDWLNLISRQPTAYDVDKVVENLKEHDGACPECEYIDECKGCSVGERLMIVRSGGKE